MNEEKRKSDSNPEKENVHIHLDLAFKDQLLENLPIRTWVVNSQLQLIYASKSCTKNCPVFSLQKPEIGQNVIEMIAPKSSKKIWEERLMHVLDGETLTFDESKTKDGNTHYFQCTMKPFRLDETIRGVQVVINEVTSLVQAKEQESEIRFRLKRVYEQIDDLYYEVDLDGKITELSPAIESISGYKRENLLGKDVSNLYANKLDRESFLESIKKQGKVKNYITTFVDKDGKNRSTSISASLVLSKNGTPAKIVGVIRDITEIENTTRSLHWFRRAVEHNPVSIVITDKKGTIEYANPFFCKITGYKISEVIGKNPSILKTDHHPEQFYKELWQTITNGELWNGTFKNKRKDGSFFWERAIITPIKNNRGDISNFIAIKEDYTNEKKAHDEIERLKSFNDLVISTMQEGILVEDVNGKIIYTNPSFSRLTGYNTDEIIGQNSNFFLSEQQGEILEKIINQREQKEPDFYEINLVTKNGAFASVNVGISPIIKDGTYAGRIAVFTDISKLKKNQETLKKALKQAKLADKLKSSFLANMSHEIRTPMNVILGFADILREERDLDEETREEYFDIIDQKGHDLLQIISDIIDIAKIESKTIDLKNKEFLLDQFLETVFTQFKEKMSISDPIELKLSIDSQLTNFTITADKHRLSQIINNLLNNAHKFTEKGEIELGCKQTGSQVLFYVRDTGIGISPKDTMVIFQRFRQADDKYTRGFGGTGLGLHVCKKLLKMMNGEIWVESKINEGSTFFFKIPI